MHSITKKALTLAAALSLVGAYALHTPSVHADDDMSMSKDKGMMDKPMMMDADMKKMVSDPANQPTADDLAKAKAMHQMVMLMMKDPDCQKMCMDMSKDPKMMAGDDAVKMAKESMMKDPAMVKMAMAQAMVMMSMKMDKGMMDKGMMDKDASHMGMDHGQTGGMAPTK